MITSLQGKLLKVKPLHAFMDVNGVGYGIHISLTTYEKLQELENQNVFIYTRVIYRENDQLIYGFLSEEERELFDFIRNLQGIGPQLASNIISTMGANKFISSIENNDFDHLMKVPKIGKNKSEKILFESNQKIKKLNELKKIFSVKPLNNNESKMKIKDEQEVSFIDQVEEVLFNLGFQKKEIQQAENKVIKYEKKLPDKTINQIQQWIKLYLRYL